MKTYLSLGSNLGNREETIHKAIACIEAQVGAVIRRSAFYYSAPWGFESEHEFCNLCVCVETTLDPLALLHRLQAIERELGRTPHSTAPTRTYEDRTIDIDIILYEHITITTPELTIPHPLYQQRDFVLTPLHEIYTDYAL